MLDLVCFKSLNTFKLMDLLVTVVIFFFMKLSVVTKWSNLNQSACVRAWFFFLVIWFFSLLCSLTLDSNEDTGSKS